MNCSSKWLCAILLLSAAVAVGQEVKPPELLRSLNFEVQRGNYGEALALANQIIRLEPKSAQSYLARGQIYSFKREFDQALADFSQALSLDPRAWQIYQQRGSVHFKAGHIPESIADFNKVIELQPPQGPLQWQRGIALYEGGRFEDGRKQFEICQLVSSNDVENATWHFACTAKAKNFDKARGSLLPVKGDTRVPMTQVYALYQGKGSIDDIFNAAKEGSPSTAELNRRLFYANFYAGMFFEARNGDKTALDYINRAVEKSDGMDYMADVARIHAESLKKRMAKAASKK